MIIQTAFPGAQTGVSYQFYSISGMIGSPITAGITTPVAALPGLYVAAATVPAGAIGVYWACANPALQSFEDLRDAMALAAVESQTNLIPPEPAAVGSQMDLVSAPNAAAVGAIQAGLLLSANYVAPSNSTIALLWAQVQLIPRSGTTFLWTNVANTTTSDTVAISTP